MRSKADRKGKCMLSARRLARRLLQGLLVLITAFGVLGWPMTAYARGTTVSVGNASGGPGSEVEVVVSVSGNPGILGATFQVSYDAGLTLTKAASGEAFSSLTMTKPGSLASPCRFTWDGVEIASEDIKDGPVLVLTFTIAEDAESGAEYGVSVTGDAGAVLDADVNPIDVTYEAGKVSVISYIPGDVDGNRVVNSRDVIFARRYIVGGYAQDIYVPAADVNDDLTINSADVILMRRFIAGGYKVDGEDLVLKPSRLAKPNPIPSHTHELEAVAAKSPTCTENGNLAYWHCTGCDKYFSDAAGKTEITLESTVVASQGHTWVIDEAIAPTHDKEGRTEGSHCAVCGKVDKVPEPIPPLQANEYFITYDVANGDPYLAGLTIENPNKTSYYEGESFKLSNLAVDGYRFLGWYDGAGDDSTKVTRVDATTAENLELYAHWQVISYKVQFQSDLMLDTNSATYTVDSGLVLPTPKLSNYVFVGWTDTNGELYSKSIEAGATGNKTLIANWTSERNKTYTNPNPSDPIIIEDEENKVILAAYEIGRIENVPLYTIKDFGYINGGVTRTETATYSSTVSEGTAQTIAETVSEATTKSSNWVLSENWNESTSISEEWCQANGYTVQEAESICKTDGKNWNVTKGKSWSEGSVVAETDNKGWEKETKTGSKETSGKSGKITGEMNVHQDALGSGYSATLGGEYGQETGNEKSKDKTKVKNGEKGTVTTTDNSKKFNSSSSYAGSTSTSKTNSLTKTITEEISKKTGYGHNYIFERGTTESQGYSQSTDTSNTYSSTVTYDLSTKQEVSSTWTTASTKPGYHRWIVAGTAHVYGVVGFDIEKETYFVYTISIMDDETHEFEDYSNTSALYNDEENGVISFTVPYQDIYTACSDLTFASDGLKVDPQTGTIVDYTGDDTYVVVPEYYNAGNGDVVKITGISSKAFAGNKDIVTVVLSDYVTAIPAKAFEGCSSLRFVEAYGVTSIGERAFANCSSLEHNSVSSSVTSLGVGAFDGAGALNVNAASKDVVTNAVLSGAKSVTIDCAYLPKDNDVLDGVLLDVPSSVDHFELNGDERTFNGLSINSNAGETVLNKINIVGNKSFPVKIASPKVTLNQSSITSPGISLLLSADTAEVGLRGTTTVDSTGANAMLCRNIKLYETANNVVGKLSVPKKLFVYGSVEGSRYLQCNDVETIDQAVYDCLLNPRSVTFDANGGTCDEVSRELAYGAAIGELPVPTRDYCKFDGWYLNDNTQVTADTVLPATENQTLVARWSDKEVSDWVKASEMPEGAQVVSTKWSYDLTKYKQVVDSYTYYRYCSYYGGKWQQDSIPINGSSVYHECMVSSPLPSQANRFTDQGGRSGDICGPHINCEHKREGQSFWWLKQTNYKTVVDRVEKKESTTKPSGNDISNVVEWVQYRAK